MPGRDQLPSKEHSPSFLDPSGRIISDLVDNIPPLARQKPSKHPLDSSRSQVKALVFDLLLEEQLKPDGIQLLEQFILLHNAEPQAKVVLVILHQLLFLHILLGINPQPLSLPLFAEQLFFESSIFLGLKRQVVLFKWVFHSIANDPIVVVLRCNHLVAVITELFR